MNHGYSRDTRTHRWTQIRKIPILDRIYRIDKIWRNDFDRMDR